ncbi:AAA family ATPase [Proteus terrae]|uniref:AAA family ATPase n=1 Tax=Proteus terrae TaxID=1574161 RepID=UPI00288B0B40|nr:AAA family ATPase [Proteus terrae]
MLITKIEIDNLYSFKDAKLELSYDKKPVDSGILEDEFLYGRTKFNVKRVCVVVGANATGKTSLGKIILGIQLFFDKKTIKEDLLSIYDKEKSGCISIDFATQDDFKLHRLVLKINEKNTFINNVEHLSYGSVYIEKEDSCKKATCKLDLLFSRNAVEIKKTDDFIDSDIEGVLKAYEKFSKLHFNLSWHYILSQNVESTTELSHLDHKVLEAVLKTFDPSIINVSILKSNDDSDASGYYVDFYNGDKSLIGMDGSATNPNRFSKGTYESIKVASLLSRIIKDDEYYRKSKINDGFTTYYLDEKMAHCHTELERVILTALIMRLHRNGQLFYTTHNYDVLSLDLPTHSFTFINKTEEKKTKFIEAISRFKKNDRSLKRVVENNLFNTDPDTELLNDLMMDDN